MCIHHCLFQWLVDASLFLLSFSHWLPPPFTAYMSITDIDVPKGSILESDSPDPRLLNVERLGTRYGYSMSLSGLDTEALSCSDYRTQTWKNGLGETSEIYIHPPDKDFKSDPFFWRLSKHVIEANCNFSVFPGYEW